MCTWSVVVGFIANFLLLLCLDANEGRETKKKKKISYHLYLEIGMERESKIGNYLFVYTP